MVTKNFIITEKGKKNGYTIDGIIREVYHIACATEYDIYGQSSLYANSYCKGNCLLGVSISADKESEIDSFVKWRIEQGYMEKVQS